MNSRPGPTPDPTSLALFGGGRPAIADLVERLRSLAPRHSRYETVAEIGQGGMGTVLRVRDRVLARELAMKVVSDASQRRFLDEATITGQLDHPGIVPVHELGVGADGRLFFTMRLIEGHTFADVILWAARGEHGFTRVRALEVVHRACEAVAHAHRRGVIHRDLKPANVMVGSFGETYVVDWGLARIVNAPAAKEVEAASRSADARTVRPSGAAASDSDLRTLHGSVLGTPAYMPPEQASGRLDEIGATADVYALGAMLYHLLAGHPPYGDRIAPDAPAEAVVAAVRAGPPTALARIDPKAAPELVSICEKAMRRDPRERYADMGEMAADLRAFLENRVVRAHRTGALTELRKWIARNRKATAAAALALVATLGGLGAVAAVTNAKNLEQKRANDEAQARYDDVTRLEAQKRVRDLVQEADTLWPATEAQLPAMTRWLANAKEVAAGRPRHAATLAGLERRNVAKPGEPARFADPFDAQFDQWWHESLSQLLQGIDALTADAPLHVGTIAEMERRSASARSLRGRSLDDHADEWQAAQAAVAADKRFGGLALAPQLGLVPIGPDPDSGFQEFCHVDSGARPLRDPATRKLLLTEATGLVLVLLPGGRFTCGSQSKEVAAQDYDPDARPDDDTVAVELAPFFLSKYEMTQAQWLRTMGSNPSRHRPQPADCTFPHTLLHPVESISWIDASGALRRLGLMLPTSAQWEYAARAGTSKLYYASDDARSLQGAGNVFDLSLAAKARVEAQPLFDWDDGFPCTAPVGSFAPNGFGLHDMVGNVMEQCRDLFVGRRLGTDFAPGDGEQRANPKVRLSGERVCRGANFLSPVHYSRAWYETSKPADSRTETMGVRPARELER